jgi:hypothetical protein
MSKSLFGNAAKGAWNANFSRQLDRLKPVFRAFQNTL